MIDKKIVILTTMRDFSGGPHDEIQKAFLNSIEINNYKNFKVYINIFNEQNIIKNLNDKNYIIFLKNNKDDFENGIDYKYSWSKVFINFLEYIDKNELKNQILIWSTADVIFEPYFFELIVNIFNKQPYSCATSLPHKIYTNLEDFKRNKSFKYEWLDGGLDVIIFDGVVFDLYFDNILNDFKNYLNINYGYFEHFLTAIGKKYFKNLINLWPYTKISKILNQPTDPNVMKSTPQWVSKSMEFNKISFYNFLNDNKIYYDELYYWSYYKIDGFKNKMYFIVKNIFAIIKVFVKSKFPIFFILLKKIKTRFLIKSNE